MLKYSDMQILKKVIDEDDFPDDVIVDYDRGNIGFDDIFGPEQLGKASRYLSYTEHCNKEMHGLMFFKEIAGIESIAKEMMPGRRER